MKFRLHKTSSLDDKVAAIFYFTGLDRITTDSQSLHTAFYKLRSQHSELLGDLHFKAGGRFPYSEDLEQTFPGLVLGGLVSQEAPWYRFYTISSRQRKLIEKNVVPIFSEGELREIKEIASEIKKLGGCEE